MFNTIFNIAASAMSAHRLRINTIASNIANAETTHTAEGGPYKRRDVVFSATDIKAEDFGNELDQASLKGVKVASVVTDNKEPRLVYQPGHPDADRNTGMVAYPNVNVVSEMTNLISANAAYKAAAEVVSLTKEMAAAIRRLSEQL